MIAEEQLAGITMTRVRALLRTAAKTGLRAEAVERRYGEASAQELFAALVAHGYLRPADAIGRHWSTEAGAALARSRAPKTFTPRAVKRALDGFVSRCGTLARSAGAIRLATKAILYGGATANRASRPRLWLTMAYTPVGDMQRRAFDSGKLGTLHLGGRRFFSGADWEEASDQAAMNFLRGRSPILEIASTTPGQPTADGALVVFEIVGGLVCTASEASRDAYLSRSASPRLPLLSPRGGARARAPAPVPARDTGSGSDSGSGSLPPRRRVSVVRAILWPMPSPRAPRAVAVAPPPAPLLLKSGEVAELLRVHPKQIYRLLDQGLPGRRVGSEWRFVREEVLAWSEARGASAVDARPAVASASSGPPPLLAANGDVIVELLLRLHREQGRPLVGLVQTDAEGALTALRDERVLFAGFHGSLPPSYLDDFRIARLHLGTREVGLAARSPRDCASVRALAGKRLASRPPSAGIRGHLDRALAAEGLTLARLRTKTTLHATHVETVAAVVRGEADVALTSAGWAQRFGLAFLPIAKEPYDLLLRAAHLGHPAAVGLCETAQDPAFRAALRATGHYEGREAGAIHYRPAG